MIKIKNFFFLTLFLALTVLIWGVSDFVISNTFIKKQENCYIFEEKFYKLKENCKGKFRFKTSFPATNISSPNKFWPGIFLAGNISGRKHFWLVRFPTKKNLLARLSFSRVVSIY